MLPKVDQLTEQYFLARADGADEHQQGGEVEHDEDGQEELHHLVLLDRSELLDRVVVAGLFFRRGHGHRGGGQNKDIV